MSVCCFPGLQLKNIEQISTPTENQFFHFYFKAGLLVFVLQLPHYFPVSASYASNLKCMYFYYLFIA